MALHSFSAGTIAHAAEINDNFNYIMTILVGLGAVDRVGELGIGPRSTGLITAAQDTGGGEGNFLQIGWNADWNKVGNDYQFSRILPQGKATAIRIGKDGFQVFSTPNTSGNLNGQMKSIFHVNIVDDGSYVYIPPSFNLTNVDRTPTTLQERRLTYTPMNTPPAIYADAWLPKQTVVKKASDYGVPSNASAISIFAYVTATNNSGAGFKMYQERAGRSERYGFTVHAALGAWGVGQRAGGWGVVPLGQSSYKSKFVIETTEAFDTARVYIVGYWS